MDTSDTVLQKWWDAKKKLKKLEEKVEKYKKAIDKVMTRKGTNRIVGNYYSVQKRSNTRTFISKNSVPPSIWNQYSSRCTYESYHLTET